jgi:hypothetical protein
LLGYWLQLDWDAKELKGAHSRRVFCLVPATAVAPAQLLQRLLEGHEAGLTFWIARGPIHEHTDPSHPVRLLRGRGERQRVPGLYASFWHGLWVPKGTPTDIIGKLNSAVQAALADATVRQRFADQGQDIPPREQQTPEALAAQQKAEIEKWWPILKAANIKAE